MQLTLLVNYSDGSQSVLRHVAKVKTQLAEMDTRIRVINIHNVDAAERDKILAKWRGKIPILFERNLPLASSSAAVIEYINMGLDAAPAQRTAPARGRATPDRSIETEEGMSDWVSTMGIEGYMNDEGRGEAQFGDGVSEDTIKKKMSGFASRGRPQQSDRPTTRLGEMIRRKNGRGSGGVGVDREDRMDEEATEEYTPRPPPIRRGPMPGLEPSESFAEPEMETPMDNSDSLLTQFDGQIG